MRRMLIAAVMVVVPALALWGQTKGVRPVRRAEPPKVKNGNVFFADAFREGLVGERPADLGKKAEAATAASSALAGGSGAVAASGGWMGLISPATIEDQIKAMKQKVDKDVTTLSDFKGKGHKLARCDYSVLAMLFGIAAEYEGDVRWKKDAAVARDAFSRSAANFKVATDQAYNEAKARKQELAELISGSAPFGAKTAEAKANWSQVAGRAPLMQYLEAVWEPRLKPAISDKAQFTSNSDKLLRDAEMFAAVAEVLAKEGMEDADSAEYKAFCYKLRDGAKEIISAVKQKNFGEASKAGGTISKACAECHESYRS